MLKTTTEKMVEEINGLEKCIWEDFAGDIDDLVNRSAKDFEELQKLFRLMNAFSELMLEGAKIADENSEKLDMILKILTTGKES